MQVFGWCKPICICHSDPTNSQLYQLYYRIYSLIMQRISCLHWLKRLVSSSQSLLSLKLTLKREMPSWSIWWKRLTSSSVKSTSSGMRKRSWKWIFRLPLSTRVWRVKVESSHTTQLSQQQNAVRRGRHKVAAAADTQCASTTVGKMKINDVSVDCCYMSLINTSDQNVCLDQWLLKQQSTDGPPPIHQHVRVTAADSRYSWMRRLRARGWKKLLST